MPIVKEKAVCYVVQDDHLLVFTHLQHPMRITGVQVPAGTIKPGETPNQAAERELFEETGLEGIVSRELGTSTYDVRPMRDEIANRHFLELSVPQQDLSQRWVAGEQDPRTAARLNSGNAGGCHWSKHTYLPLGSVPSSGNSASTSSDSFLSSWNGRGKWPCHRPFVLWEWNSSFRRKSSGWR